MTVIDPQAQDPSSQSGRTEITGLHIRSPTDLAQRYSNGVIWLRVRVARNYTTPGDVTSPC